jgi:hypothetical protein
MPFKFMNSKQKYFTIEPVQPGDCNGIFPEYCRAQMVQRIWGVKRGSLENLRRQGRVRSVLLRITGAKQGIRLYEVASLRALIESHLPRSAEAPVSGKGTDQP